MPHSAERNKELIRRLLAEVDRGNLDVVDACYAPGYVDHTASARAERTPAICSATPRPVAS
jgi:ketosteroid isomerase-like protein